MALTFTLDATLSGSASNSYLATVEEAAECIEFLAQMPSYGVDTAAWYRLGSPGGANVRSFALICAARDISQVAYEGEPAVVGQALPVPRVGTAFDNIIPDAIKLAQAARACAILSTPNEIDSRRARGIIAETSGDVSFNYSEQQLRSSTSQVVDTATLAILRNSGIVKGSSGSISVGRS